MKTRPRSPSPSFGPSSRFVRRGLLFLGSVAVSVVLSLSVARGDVVKMIDGRTFEGTITEETDAIVRMDAMAAGIKVKLGLSRSEVDSIEKKAVPAGFFEAVAKPDARVSRADAFPPGTTLYLEIPIVGRFGTQVVASGVQRCLSYAAGNKIPHVVFLVDSQGGDRVTAREIYELLAKYQDRITYHAIVRDAVGGAMVVPIVCSDVFVLPGASLGGVAVSPPKGADQSSEAVLAQTAYDAGATAEKFGWPAALVRAMIDPAEVVYAWRDSSGRLATAAQPPSSGEELIIQDGPDSILTFTGSQAVALGLAKAYDGDAEGLGAELKLDNWTRESDYASKTMAEAAKTEQKRQASVATRKETEIRKLVKQRDTVALYLDRNLKISNEWDPNQNAQSTYEQYQASWESYWGGGTIPQSISPTRWRELTDITVAALTACRKGILELKMLDEKGKKLGVEPAYQDGELDKMQKDVELKIMKLQYWRTRKTGS